MDAIVFDIGGVLLDWNPRYLYRRDFGGDDAAIDAFLGEIGFTAWNHEQDLGRPFAEAVSVLCKQFPHHCELIRAYDERWAESIGGAIEPTVQILAGLKRANSRSLYALTNFSDEKFRLVRSRYAFFDWFDHIVVSGEVRLAKPDPRIFEVLLERTGRAAHECLFIDDSAANVEAAARLGFDVIRFTSPAQLAAELAARGDTM